MAILSLTHQYVRPVDPSSHTTLLLLHGTGGDEHDLLPLGRALLPGAGMLSPRGKVLENGMPRFFRRLAEGVFDQEDLAVRTDELAEFVDQAADAYAFDRARVIAAGFSNGANIAASMLLRKGAVLRGAALFSPMVPFEPTAPVSLASTRVFIGAGRRDPIVPLPQVERLRELLVQSGADVTLHWQDGGHTITNDELAAAQQWISP
ncbi:MAG TPA: alpha/beta hydrolase [Gemmatimonadaceae bacterium]|nr:alpha/beta hydrolase [Gemmatimonadaceae bacterium]